MIMQNLKKICKEFKKVEKVYRKEIDFIKNTYFIARIK